MTQTSASTLDEILLILDQHRGRLLETRALSEKDSEEYKKYSVALRLITALKKQIPDVFEDEQKHLGL